MEIIRIFHLKKSYALNEKIIVLYINNDKINLFGCKNGHHSNNILLKDYQNTRRIPTLKIICSLK